MTPFSVGFHQELVKLANIVERPLPPTASYRSDTKHFGAPEPGGPQNSGGHQVGPDGTWRGIEVPGDSPDPIKVANDPIQARRVVRGVRCAIEWPKGTKRKYMDKKDPKKVNYEKLMKADYGYIPGTEDADGEQLDVYVGPDLKSDKVFVIRQLKDDGSFDENKVMMGYDTFEAAKKSYLDHMPRKRLGRVTQTTVEHFKKGHLHESRQSFKKAASLGVPRGASDPVIAQFTPRMKKKQRAPDGGDHQECAQCTAADEVQDSVAMSASNAESHFQ